MCEYDKLEGIKYTIVKTKARTFKQLLAAEKKGTITAKVVEKARIWLQEGQTDYHWWDSIYEFWNAALAQLGFEGSEINFSDLGEQGGGAGFTSSTLDFKKLIPYLSGTVSLADCVTVDAEGKEDYRGYVAKLIHLPELEEARYAELLLVESQLSGEVQRLRSNYYHSKTTEAVIDFEPEDQDDNEYAVNVPALLEVDKVLDDFRRDVDALRGRICDKIYEQLQAECEYLVSDESLIETSEANDYRFDERGGII